MEDELPNLCWPFVLWKRKRARTERKQELTAPLAGVIDPTVVADISLR